MLLGAFYAKIKANQPRSPIFGWSVFYFFRKHTLLKMCILQTTAHSICKYKSTAKPVHTLFQNTKYNWIFNHIEWCWCWIYFMSRHTMPFSFRNGIEIHYMHVLFSVYLFLYISIVPFNFPRYRSIFMAHNVSHQFVLQFTFDKQKKKREKVMTKYHTHTTITILYFAYKTCTNALVCSNEWIPLFYFFFKNSIRSR